MCACGFSRRPGHQAEYSRASGPLHGFRYVVLTCKLVPPSGRQGQCLLAAAGALGCTGASLAVPGERLLRQAVTAFSLYAEEFGVKAGSVNLMLLSLLMNTRTGTWAPGARCWCFTTLAPAQQGSFVLTAS